MEAEPPAKSLLTLNSRVSAITVSAGASAPSGWRASHESSNQTPPTLRAGDNTPRSCDCSACAA